MRRYNPWLAAAVAAIALLALAMFVMRRGSIEASQTTDNDTATAAVVAKPEKRCTSDRTYGSIKLELFRTAAQTRGSDRDAYDRISAYSVVRMERPLLIGYEENLGTTRCSGRLSLDLPPGLSVVGGRRTLSADIDYVVQPAADGSGDVVVLEGVAPIIVPLATIARSGSHAPLAPDASPQIAMNEPIDQPTPQPRPEDRPPLPDRPNVEVPARTSPPTSVSRVRTVQSDSEQVHQEVRRTAKGRPSFNCRYARTNGEKAICSNPALASLDRQMASQYYRAVASANASQRQRLVATRIDFLRHRDRCASDACIAASYRERIREIADVSGR
ncbi:MAG: hypothetical protein ABI667_04365 [Sphingomicrobium sp.]